MHPATDLSLGDSTVSRLVVRRLGRRGYADACALQERAACSVAGGGADELLYVEHAPVITLGRGTDARQILASRTDLAAAGIAVVDTDRGGGATYHGPGQLVGYPIIDLRRRGLGVRAYLRALEMAIVAMLHDDGVCCHIRPGLTGVWTTRGKVAAIGVAVRRGITRHGFALNIAPDLSAFGRIVPCGLRQPVTALEDLGWHGNPAQLQRRLARALQTALGEREDAPVLTMRAAGSDAWVAGGAPL